MKGFVLPYIYILITLMSLQAVAEGFFGYQELENHLQAVSEIMDKDDLLTFLEQGHHELKIIVLDLPSPLESGEALISWRDLSLSNEVLEAYQEYTSRFLQSVAYFVAPGVSLRNFSPRPLSNRPVMVLKAATPRHALLHEYGHYLVDARQRQQIGPTVDEGSPLGRLVYKTAEEVFIDTLLIEQKQDLQFSQQDICFRHKYLSQNLQLMGFKMGELDSSELSLRELSVLSEVRELYARANRTVLNLRTECFLFSYQ